MTASEAGLSAIPVPGEGSSANPGPADEVLMRAYARGDVEAFEELYRRHRVPLYRFVLRAVGSPATAEELYQDVWMRLIDARQRYRPTARFQTWLYRIAHNRIVDHYRGRRPAVSLSEPHPEHWLEDPAGGDPGREMDRTAAHKRLRLALSSLPLEQRTALLLQAVDGLSLEQIGKVCGVGRETVKSRLRYAMGRLREALGGGP